MSFPLFRGARVVVTLGALVAGTFLGHASASGDDAEGAPAAECAPAPTPAPAPSPGGGDRAAGKPSDVLDLTNWYLGLPTGEQGKPDNVEQPELAAYSSEWFQLNAAKDGVVFKARADGVHTSGSQYPRSELREMNGSEKASWDGSSGTHTMEIRQAITATPTEKPDVIAGQIHATSDDLMQIHLSGKRLTVKYDDGAKKVDLDPDYRLGTVFTVKIESSGGHVQVWYDGKEMADLGITSSTSYFKAGAYVNSNTAKGDAPDAYGEVVIYDLEVSHTG